MVSSSRIELIAIQGDRKDSLDLRGGAEEILRFYALSPAWMASCLNRLSKRAIVELGPEVCAQGTLECRLLRVEIPEIVARLRSTPSTQNARDPFCVRSETLCALLRSPEHHGSSAWSFLHREVRFGNPIVIALDKACPPQMESDWAAAQMRQAWARLGADGLVWRPELAHVA